LTPTIKCPLHPPGRVHLLRSGHDLTREGHQSTLTLVLLADNPLSGEKVAKALDKIIALRGAPESITVDNGPAYRSHQFARACRALGLKHRFTRPYTPRTNGKAERFIQTALRVWAYARTYQNSTERSQQLRPWLHQYNVVSCCPTSLCS
jgi:transposase InsO family protein